MSRERLRQLLVTIGADLGPVIVFYGVNHFYGLKPAIVASLVFTVVEVIWRLATGREISGLFKYSAVMTIVFGCVDLYSQESFLFKFEAAVTNLLTGAFFASSLRGGKSIIEDFYEKSPGAKPVTDALRAYFRFITWLWVGYFVIKTGAYVWMARNYSIEQGLVIRTLIGNASMYAMIGVSWLSGRYFFGWLLRRGWIAGVKAPG